MKRERRGDAVRTEFDMRQIVQVYEWPAHPSGQQTPHRRLSAAA
jgi:hypothetical protein